MLHGLIIYSKKEEDLDGEDYSVKRLIEAAKGKNIQLDIVTPSQFELVVTRSDRKSVLIDDKQIPLPDFILPRLGADTSYYAFSVIRQLGYLGVYVCNDAEAINSVKDKLCMHQILAHSSLSTPNTMLAKFPVDIEVVKREIGFPLVIKNVTGSQGSGIYLCESEEKFMDIMELVFTNNEKANLILQEFIEKSRGQDLRAFVVGGKVLACIKRSSDTSFKANFSKGGKVEPFPLTPEIEWLSTEVTKLLNLDIAGVDLLFDKGGFKVCEVNSAPGFKGLEQATGSTIAEDILDYISVRMGAGID